MRFIQLIISNSNSNVSKFSPDQHEAIERIKSFLSSSEKTLLFQGSAGTGKMM